MHFPTWVDLKGQDSVPETVHHVVCYVDPIKDTSWHKLSRKIQVSCSCTCVYTLCYVFVYNDKLLGVIEVAAYAITELYLIGLLYLHIGVTC